MLLSSITTVLSLALAQTALAGVYITNPVGSTTGNGGQVLNVQWADDGQSPTVAQVGPCSVDIFVGSQAQQTQLQNLAANVDVSKTSQVSTTVNPSIGESGNYYFVRFTSIGFKDPKNPQYPYEAFSAKFTLNGMTGTFNSTIKAQMDATAQSATSSSAADAGSTVTIHKNVAAAASSTAPSTSSTGAAGKGFTVSTSIIVSAIGLVSYLTL